MAYLTIEDGDYVLKIERDDEQHNNPREWDNIGKMICWLRDYKIGDEHDFRQPSDLFKELASNIGVNILGEGERVFNTIEASDVIKAFNEYYVIKPVYALDHSGITINTTGFANSWDSRMIGYIYASKEEFRNETGYGEDELFSKDSKRDPKLGERVKVKGRDDWGLLISKSDNCFVVDFDYNKIASARKDENVVTIQPNQVVEVMSNRAEEMLDGEVRVFDQYLTGDVYSFILTKRTECDCCGHEDEEIVDSCSGFFGTDWQENGLLENLPEKWAKKLMGHLDR